MWFHNELFPPILCNVGRVSVQGALFGYHTPEAREYRHHIIKGSPIQRFLGRFIRRCSEPGRLFCRHFLDGRGVDKYLARSLTRYQSTLGSSVRSSIKKDWFGPLPNCMLKHLTYFVKFPVDCPP